MKLKTKRKSTSKFIASNDLSRLVMDSIKELEDPRKCWRLVNGVLFEKTKGDVMPELETSVKNMDNVIKQISDTL